MPTRTEVACESDSAFVEESAATERQYHEDDDEQSSRIHLLLLCVSRAVVHVTQHVADATRRLCRWGHLPFDVRSIVTASLRPRLHEADLGTLAASWTCPMRRLIRVVCPICLLGKLELTKRSRGIDICICSMCGTGMTVPHEAWELRARAERKKS